MSSALSSLRLSPGKGGAEASNAVCNSTIETAFSPENYHEFDKNLRRETEKAYLWAATKKYAEKSPALAGCTIESCLADDSGMPVPESEQFLEYFSNVNARREMTKYNVEFEIAPVRVGEDAFADMYESLENNRRAASRCADMVGARASLFGILPSFTETHFSSDTVKNEQARLDAIDKIKNDYIVKQENKDADTELKKINLEEERKIAELDRLEATEEQKQDIRDYYAGLRNDLNAQS